MEKLLNIDRRFIYVLVAVLVSSPRYKAHRPSVRSD